MNQRVCLLTGASGRLGSAFCETSADEYRIVAVFRQRSLLAAFSENQAGNPHESAMTRAMEDGRLVEIQADLAIESERRRVVDFTLAEFGQIDVLINSAVRSVWSSIVDGSPSVQTASAQFHMNVLVPLFLSVQCAQLFWKGRKDENLSRNRNVVNISSIAGSKVYLNSGQGVYAASKAALNHLSRHMAAEFSDIGVRVNALAPNSFPRILSTNTVVESLRKLDRGTMSGSVLLLDREGESYT